MSVTVLYAKLKWFLRSFGLFALPNPTKWTTTATPSHFLLHTHSQPSVRTPYCFTHPHFVGFMIDQVFQDPSLVLPWDCPHKKGLRN